MATKYNLRRITVILILILLITILSVLTLGKAQIGVDKVIRIIAAKVLCNDNVLNNISNAHKEIIWSIRLPRILNAVLVGSGLAVSGAVFQALLMNPLADSYTMGISTGAAFGASIAIYLNIFTPGLNAPVHVFSFLGAIATIVLVVKIANVKGYLSSTNLVISGIIVSSILSAGISFIKHAAGEQVGAIVAWLMGSMAAANWTDIKICLPVIIFCTAFCIYNAYDLNILSLGDKEARYLGIDPQKKRKMFLVCGSLITSVCVASSGIIGFIGLIVPHMLRFVFGSDNRILIPLCALFGGELLLIADTSVRALLNIEIPVGIITTLLGGPFFIYIFIRNNSSLQ